MVCTYLIVFIFCVLWGNKKEIVSANKTSISCSSESRCLCKEDNGMLEADCVGLDLENIPRFSDNVTIIYLDRNSICSFPEDKRFPKLLRKLSLSRNKLNRFNNDPFQGLFKLTFLDLSNNELDYSDDTFGEEVFRDLKSLEYFNIKGNSKPKDAKEYPKSLSSLALLVTLFVDGKRSLIFGPGFQNLSRLINLDISGEVKEGNNSCDIDILHPSIFKHLPYLQYLNLSTCSLKEIQRGSFSNLQQLQTLDISFNRKLTFRVLSNLSYDLQNTDIRTLKANAIHCVSGVGTAIFAEDIKYMANTKIQNLYLEYNRLAFIEMEAMQFFPRNLSILSLEYNKMTVGWYILRMKLLTRLQVLKIGHRRGSPTIARHWDSLNNCHDWRGPYWNHTTATDAKKYSDLQDGFIAYPPKLEKIYAENAGFGPDILQSGLSADKNNVIQYLHFNHNNLFRWNGTFKNFHNLTYLDLSHNSCNDISVDFFQDLPNLQILIISYNLLSPVLLRDKNGDIFRNLNNLMTLDLSNNDLSCLPKELFKGLNKLRKLILSKNNLIAFNFRISHMKDIELINISANRIPSLSQDAMSDIDTIAGKNFTIDLTGNDLQCNCEVLCFLNWIENRANIFNGFQTYTCKIPNWSKTVSFLHLQSEINTLKTNCNSYVGLVVGVLISITCCIAIVIAGIIYRFRWKLRYLYYMSQIRMRGYRQLKMTDMHKYKNDAFISYANEDRTFVEEELLEQLEQNFGLKLILHARDFLAGRSVAGNIAKAINSSFKTVIILSSNYLKSEWCMFEFNMARMESIYSRQGQNLLVVVRLSNVRPCDVPLTMMDIIETETYIEFPNDPQGYNTFWNHLKTAVAKEQGMNT